MRQTPAARIVPDVEDHDWGERELLIDIAAYRMERLTLTGEMTWRPEPGRPAVVVVMDGELVVGRAGEELAFATGETFIVPPGIGELTMAPVRSRSRLVIASAAPAARART
jgi:mannose-6-phosphate isomerase class I